MSPTYLTGYSIKGYKAFAAAARVDLAPLTIVLGRNNAGKTALCNAPIFFTHLFEPQASVPFPLTLRGIDFCASLMSACFARQLSGFSASLFLRGDGGVSEVTVGGAAVSESNQRQILTELTIEHPEHPLRERGVIEWPKAKALLSNYPELSRLSSTIGTLTGQRPPVERYYRYLGGPPQGIGPAGEDAVQYLAIAKTDGRDDVFEKLNSWFAPLGVVIDVKLHGEMFETTASRPGGPKVNIADAGAGIGQILPLAVALKAVPPEDLPSLFIIEQPELDMHPYAHARVAELLIDAVANNKNFRLLVETHSDALVLRLRREIAAKRLAKNDVRIYFVDESEAKGPDQGSTLREIGLNDRGTPEWWPKGVFAESQAEFHRIRQELAKRDGRA
jgi:hypothetical protein